MPHYVSTSLFCMVCGLFTTVAYAQPPVHGTVAGNGTFADTVSPEQQARMDAQAERNIAALERTGSFTRPKALAATTVADLQWPLAPIAGFDAPGYHGVSNFVDHGPPYPGAVQDYTCGNRSYNLANGYNHAGTDYYLWPFPWLMMDQGDVQIVAAAPSTLVATADGNFDRNCAIDSNTSPNFVRLLQDDGFTAIYLHMRSGSVTTLPVGAHIAAGTYLGLVGSSGQSSGPHLHFELRDGSGTVVDPRHGDCNAAPDRWAVFQPYEDPHIDTLSTHSAEPNQIACGYANGADYTDEPHYQDAFSPGDAFWVFASYRDQRNGEVTNFRILRPDASVFAQWDFDLASEKLPAPFYSGTSWDWQHTLPLDAPIGAWQVQAQFQGQTYTHNFSVVVASRSFDAATDGNARVQVGKQATRCRAVAGAAAPVCQP